MASSRSLGNRAILVSKRQTTRPRSPFPTVTLAKLPTTKPASIITAADITTPNWAGSSSQILKFLIRQTLKASIDTPIAEITR
jgi:hypothetical protein